MKENKIVGEYSQDGEQEKARWTKVTVTRSDRIPPAGILHSAPRENQLRLRKKRELQAPSKHKESIGDNGNS